MSKTTGRRRVRFAAPSGPLLLTGARAALANFRFARGRQGHFTLRHADDRMMAELRWLGIDWDAAGEPGDHAEAIARLKHMGRLYPCFESDVELRAKREFRIKRGRSAVYDRAMLKLTPEQRAAAEAGGKTPHWRFRLSPRIVTWMDPIHGRGEAKLPAVSDPVLVAADGTPAAALTAVVDDARDGITHVIRADDGEGMTGIHIDLLDTLGHDSAAVTFARLPVLGNTGRLAVRNLRQDGIEAESLLSWLGCGERFNIRDLAAVPEPETLPAVNRAVLARREFDAVADRLPPGATAAFWLAVRGHVDLLTEARHWWDVVNGTLFPPVPEDAALLAREARRTLPEEPWDTATWRLWLASIPADASPDNARVLRLMLTGEEQGPALDALLPLMGRIRVLARLSGA